MKSNSFSKGIITGLISFFLNIVQSILFVPYIFRYWGNDNYSIWIIIIGVINLFRTFDSGHQTFIGNEFGKYLLINPDYARKILGSSIKFAFLIGILQIIFFLIIILSNFDVFLFGIEFLKYTNIFTLICIFLWIIATSVAGILARILTITGFYSRAQIWGIIQKISEIAVLYFGILFDIKFNLIFTIYCLILLLYTLSTMLDIRYKLSKFFPWWRDGDLKTGYHNFKISLALSLNIFLEQFTLTSINSSISNLFTAVTIPLYTTLRTIGNVTSQFSSIILQPVQSDLIVLHHKKKTNKIILLFYLFWFFTYLFIFIPLLVLLPFIQPIYELWTSGKIIYNSNLTVSVLSGVIIYNFGRSSIFYLGIINDLKALTTNNIFRFILIIPFSFILGKYFNSIVAFSWGITIGEFIVSIILPLYYVKNHLKLSFNTYYIIAHVMFVIYFIFLITFLSKKYLLIINYSFIFLFFSFFIYLWYALPKLFKSYLKKQIIKKFNFFLSKYI